MTAELERAEQFHGHLGPWLAIGLRLGQAALERLGARSHFGVRVEAAVPNRPPVSCLLDGLQLSTGATAGKMNLCVREAAVPSVTIINTETGARVRAAFPAELPGKLVAWLAAEGDRRAAMRVMDLPAEMLFTLAEEGPAE